MEHPCLGERQVQAANCRLATRHPLRGGGVVAELQFGAREDGVEPAAPPGLDQREVGQARGAELFDAALGLADLEPDHPDVGVRRAREDALVKRVQQRDGLLGRRAGAIDVTQLRGRPGLRDQRKPDGLRVPGQAAGLDRRLGGGQRLAQAAEALQSLCEPDHHRHDELALTDGARERDAAPEVPRRVVVGLAEVLGEAEVVRQVEPSREQFVRERVKPGGARDAGRLGRPSRPGRTRRSTRAPRPPRAGRDRRAPPRSAPRAPPICCIAPKSLS